MNSFHSFHYSVIFYMSHLISGVDCEGQLVFGNAHQRAPRPNFKKYLRSNTLENILEKKAPERIMETICLRYS
jgi:hypothetical protein